MLTITSLHFDYHDKLFLQNINLMLPAGGLLHLRGANGAGKTTLLRLIAGLFEADSGNITINGISVIKDPGAYRQQFCFLSHKSGLNPYLTVMETLCLDPQTAPGQNFQLLLSEFCLQDFADSCCGNLSAGQQRRVALLRLTLSTAKLWLLDEPLVALDEQGISILASRIRRHRLHGGAVLLTSHQALSAEFGDYQEYQLC